MAAGPLPLGAQVSSYFNLNFLPYSLLLYCMWASPQEDTGIEISECWIFSTKIPFGIPQLCPQLPLPHSAGLLSFGAVQGLEKEQKPYERWSWCLYQGTQKVTSLQDTVTTIAHEFDNKSKYG